MSFPREAAATGYASGQQGAGGGEMNTCTWGMTSDMSSKDSGRSAFSLPAVHVPKQLSNR